MITSPIFFFIERAAAAVQGANRIGYGFPYLLLRLCGWAPQQSRCFFASLHHTWPLEKRGAAWGPCSSGGSFSPSRSQALGGLKGPVSTVTHLEYISGSSELSNVDSVTLWPSVDLTRAIHSTHHSVPFTDTRRCGRCLT